MKYIKTMRMKKAKTLLQFSDMSITMIAESVGFKNIQYFSRVFTEYYNVNPSLYRSSFYKKVRRSSMSKLTRISVMSSKGPDSKGYNDIKALNQINSDYWSEKIENVLDSAPDIIILPENCDRFTDFSYKQQLAYITNGGSIENLIVKMAKNIKPI